MDERFGHGLRGTVWSSVTSLDKGERFGHGRRFCHEEQFGL